METIKEKEKADLEQLLNSLIEKGRCPANRTKRWEIYKCEVRWLPWYVNVRFLLKDKDYGNYGMNIRELVAKESWLWQFVCENHLYIYKMWENKNFIQDHFKNEYNECCYQYLYDKSCYEYYLLESSLKDESELEDFLLQNIKVWND